MIVKRVINHYEDMNINIKGITLLSVDEFKKYKNVINNVNCNWWLRSPGLTQYNAALVNGSGDVIELGHSVNYDFVGIRPALKLGKTRYLHIKDKFLFNDYTWTVISEEYAICDNIIEYDKFDDISNNYAESYIRTHLEKWYYEATHNIIPIYDNNTYKIQGIIKTACTPKQIQGYIDDMKQEYPNDYNNITLMNCLPEDAEIIWFEDCDWVRW